MASNGAAKRRRLKQLYEQQGGKCHWCQEHCLLPGDEGYQRKTGALSGKAATQDHLFHRLDPRRHLPGGGKSVMACSTCNGKRGLADATRLAEQYPTTESARQQAQHEVLKHILAKVKPAPDTEYQLGERVRVKKGKNIYAPQFGMKG